MLTWRVGDVKITRVVEMDIPFKYNEKHPFISEARPEVLK